jgi:hypothetical protein
VLPSLGVTGNLYAKISSKNLPEKTDFIIVMLPTTTPHSLCKCNVIRVTRAIRILNTIKCSYRRGLNTHWMVTGRFIPLPFRPLAVSSPSRFVPFTFRPLHVSSPSRFVPFTFRHLHVSSPSRFVPFTFRHLHVSSPSRFVTFTFRPLHVSSPSRFVPFTFRHLHVSSPSRFVPFTFTFRPHTR